LAEALFRVPKHPLMLDPKAGEARRDFGGKGVCRQARAEVGPKFLSLSAVGVDRLSRYIGEIMQHVTFIRLWHIPDYVMQLAKEK